MKLYTIIIFCLPFLCWAQNKPDAIKNELKDTAINLNSVSISGKKPLIKRKADRLEFNINNTPLQNLNGWEILKNTPNVLVKNDALTVRGNTQIVVTINDKRTLMSQDQLKQYLEGIEGSNVSAIEVITNPPAKYEAQGGAIINIKMKQNALLGYKGRVGLRYHQSIYAKGAISTMQSYNTNKWQFTGNYAFTVGDYVRKNFDVVTFADSKTRWESDMVRKTEAHNQHRYDFAGQYNLDTLQSISFGFDGNNNPKALGNYMVPTQIFNTDNNEMVSHYLTNNKRFQQYGTLNAYLVYDKKFGANNFTWSNNFSTKYYNEDQDIATYLNFANQVLSFNRFASGSKQEINLYATQLDYQYKKEESVLEGGAKFSHVFNRNDLSFYDATVNSTTYNPTKSNLFNYNENIFAGYVSAAYKLKDWEFKAGLRTETTGIKTKSNNPVVENNKNTTSLFPTLYVMHSLGENEQLGFSYGKRIDRPNYDFLNPSKSYYNLYAYFQGDANLKSTLIHNLSLTYTINSWNLEAYYSFNKTPSMEISVQNPSTFETVYHFTNIDKSQNWGANVSKNFRLNSFWNLNMFAMAEYNENFYLGVDEQLYKNKVLFYNANLSSQITLDKAKTWDLNLAYNYNSKSIQGSFNISSSQNFNIILNKKMLNKRLESYLILNDIFKTDKSTITTNYANQNQSFKDYRDTRYFIVGFRYNFGNQKAKETKVVKKTEEQKRL